METLKANGTLPHWHWQPEDLQQSCLSADLVKGSLECGESWDNAGWDDALCIGQASSAPVESP
jgi:hypothetical protein